MNKTIKTISGILFAALLVVGVIHFVSPQSESVETNTYGAATGPDLYSPYFNVNGFYEWYTRQAIVQSTTTPCAFKSPAATSSLAFADLNITTATSTATTWTIAFANTPYATTTLDMPAYSVGSGAQATLIASGSTTPIAPNTYVVWGMAGVANPSTGLKGTCQAKFNQI